MNSSVHPSRRPRAGALLTAAAGVALLGLAPVAHAASRGPALPLGAKSLPETRTSRSLANGVTLTRIVRGKDPAPAGEIGTTAQGPWLVSVLTIDPRKARGHLRATYGPDLAGVEPTTQLVRTAGALAGTNASFFTFNARPQYPGDPVGLGLFGGRVLSEPSNHPAEVDLLVDASTNKVTIGRLRWTGTVENRRTRTRLSIHSVNRPPVVPGACADLADQTRCAAPGDLVRFTADFASETPSGPGIEVVLSQSGCVVGTSTTRGTRLAPGQTSLQATGREAAALLEVAHGCLTQTDVLRNDKGKQIPLRTRQFAVSGRYRLLARGKVVVPAGSGSFFERNPRTIAGTTRDGTIVMATIDGRRVTSVGTTLSETAEVAKALGLHEAVNLDGGGSTTMSHQGALANQPSGSAERAVGDALVFLGGRYSGR